jgi:DNA-binding transcriptional regulator GbsR (MarR family)
MDLTPAMRDFILHWGEMGARWGVNRTIAQIHALLYLAAEPLTADEIAETLAVARSNVSTSLRELQNWGLAQIVPILGDRRDRFTTQKDVWDLFLVIAGQRVEREIVPTLQMLRQCAGAIERERNAESSAKKRIAELLGFVENLHGWYGQVQSLPRGVLAALLKMGAGVARLVPAKRRIAR